MATRRLAAIADTLGGEPIVVFSRAEGPTATAFRAESDGRPLTFKLRDKRFVDQETGSEWSLTGEAVSAPLAGPTTFWFAS